MRLVNASMEILTPGHRQPPTKAPFLSSTDSVVAVPMSMIIIGGLCSFKADTAATTRSAPVCSGLSIWILRPVLIPGPTTSGVLWVSFKMAVLMEFSTWGTTEEIIVPSIWGTRTSLRSNMVLMSTQYWSDVLIGSVAIRASK